MKPLHRILFVVVAMIFVTDGMEPAAATPQTLTGGEAVNFLQETGIFTQLVAESGSELSPEGREFFLTGRIGPDDADPDDRFGISVALDGNTALVGMQFDDVDGTADQGSAHIFHHDDGNWIWQEMLVAGDGETDDRFGFTVALSGDFALVGAPAADIDGKIDQGAAYLFARSDAPLGGDWFEMDKMSLGDMGEGGDEFGRAVALDGTTALVSAPLDDVDGAVDQGAAYVYTLEGDNWSLQDQLISEFGSAGEELGHSVALDGDTAVIGTPLDFIGLNTNQGSAYVFVRTGTDWSQQTRLVADDGLPEDWFGWALALSGNTALIGAPLADTFGQLGNADQGAAYVFVREGNIWSQQDKLTVFGGADDRFGRSVALDGRTALVGAPRHNAHGNGNQGAAYVFTEQDGDWSQQSKLTANTGGADDFLGRSVALAGDLALVGAPQAFFDGQNDIGAVYTFARGETAWLPAGMAIAAEGGEEHEFGYAVALDGSTALVGARFADVDGNSSQGAAYIFVRSSSGWEEVDTLTAVMGDAGDWFGYSVALDGGTALVGARNDQISGNDEQGAAYIFTRDGNDWSQRQRLIAADGTEDDHFGWDVALEGGTALVGAPGALVDGEDRGAAYLFVRNGNVWSEEDKLIADDGEDNDFFGRGVALDGQTALVGAPGKVIDGNISQGAAYVFALEGDDWVQQDRLIVVSDDNQNFEWFGSTVALDSGTALVGATGVKAHGQVDQGAAFAFFRRDNSWLPQGRMVVPLDESLPFDVFGNAVALHGNTALVGALGSNVDGVSQGAAYLFKRSGGLWREQARFFAQDGAESDAFGRSVALDDDTLLIGANGVDTAGDDDRGKVYFFRRATDDLFLPAVVR